MKYIQRIIICISILFLTNDLYAQDIEKIDKLLKKMELCYKEKRLDSAIIYAKQALAEVENILGKKSYGYTLILNFINKIYLKAGEINKAKNGCIENYNLLKELVKKDKKQYIGIYQVALDLLMRYYNKIGNQLEAAKLLFEKDNLYTQDMTKTDKLFFKSVICAKEKRLDSAIIYAQQALVEVKNKLGKKNNVYTKILNFLNFRYMEIGEINKARNGSIENYNLLKELVKKDKKQYTELYKWALLLLGSYYNEIGNQVEFDKLLNEQANYFPKNTLEYAGYLGSLALSYERKGNNAKAEALLLESMKKQKKHDGDSIEYAGTVSNLAALYASLGLFDKAERYILVAKNVLEKTNNINTRSNYTHAITHNLALIYCEQKKYDKAMQIFVRNRKFAKKHTKLYISATYSMASLYSKMNKKEKSEKYLNETIELSKKYFGTNSMVYIIATSSLAAKYFGEGKYKLAEKYFKKNIELIEKAYGKTHNLYLDILKNLIVCYYYMGDYKLTNKYFQQSLTIFKDRIQNNFSMLNEKEKFLYIKANNEVISVYKNFAFDYHKKIPKVTGDVFNNLLFHKKLILFNTRSLQLLINNSKDSALQNTYYRLYNTKQKIANDFTQTINKKLYAEVENLEKKILERLNILYPNKKNNAKATNYKELQNKLNKNEAIVEFTHFKRLSKDEFTDTLYYCALVLRKNYKYPKLVFLSTEKALKKILKRKPYEQKDARYITNIYNNDSKTEGRGAKLYDLIWSKIDTLLPNIKRVYISPTALLYNISFSALAINNTSCLKDKYEINYLTSSQNAINKTLYFKEINSASLFGGIIYNADSLALLSAIKNYKENNLQTVRSTFDNEKNKISLKYLPSTLKEIENIKKLFTKHNKKADIFSGVNANEEAFNNTMFTQPDLLHIGTHGYYLSQEKANHRNMFAPLHNLHTIDRSLFRSGLFLAGSQRTIDGKTALENCGDGILNSYEISMHQLNKTRLVVLSACQTGLGDVAGSEGIIGLRRAFKTAGVDYMILALWEVPSYTTMEFMNLFYKYFTEGEKIETAFSKAQNKMYKTYKLPYYWAGFVLLK